MIQRAAILPDTPPREPDPCRARYAPGEFGKRHIMCSMFGPDRVKSHGAECQHKDEWHIPVRAYSDEEIEALKAR